MRLHLVAGVFVWTAMMLAPSAMAVHGSSYNAQGIAYLTTGSCTPPVDWVGPICTPQDGTPIYNANVLWGGFNPPPGLCFDCYRVTISDTTTGAVVAQAVFLGMEQWGCCVIGPAGGVYQELFQYHGCHSTAISWNGGTCQDAPDFDIYGLQSINVNTAQQAMLYEGWMNQFALVLYVDTY